MDTALKNGDFYIGTTGKPVAISGVKEILQRVLLRLSIKKGSFIYDKSLGSDLYTLKTSSGDISQKAKSMVKEALACMKEVNVDNVTVKLENNAENLKINVLLSIGKNFEEVEVLL